MAGTPGYILLGYFVVQIIFARQKTDMGSVDGSAMIFALYALFCLYYGWKDLHKDKTSKFFFSNLFKKTPVFWFALYTAWCLVSALWSPNLSLSAFRAIECLGMMMIIASVFKNLVLKYTYQQIMLWSVTYCFLNVLLTFVAGMRAGLGIALYNCQFPSTIFFYIAFFFAPKKYIKYPMMLVALVCKSVTGYIGMTLGMCSLMFGKAKYRILGFLLFCGIGIAVASMGLDNVLNNTIFASKGGAIVDGQFAEGKSSGRDVIWKTAVDEMNREGKQLYGVGFVVGETEFAHQVIGGQVIGMHNGFLSAYIGTGYIGLFLFSLFMLGMLKITIRNGIDSTYKPVMIACMIAVFIHTVGNPGLGFRVYGTWMSAMFIVQMVIALNFKSKYSRSNFSRTQIKQKKSNEMIFN